MSIRSILATSAVLSAALLGARADPVPNTPDTGITGKTCTITWAKDTTGNWGETAIELMTGDNQAMVHLTTVTTLDSSKESTFSWTCPEVTINSAIYFYQFSAVGQTLTWTTRFALAGADGSTVTEPNATQPDGKAIPWGAGALADPSTAVAAPAWLSSSSSATSASAGTSGAASTSGSAATGSVASTSAATTSAATSSAASSAAASSSSGIVKVNTSSSASSVASSAAGTPSAAAANQSSANTSSAAALRVPALVLSVIAGVFAYAL